MTKKEYLRRLKRLLPEKEQKDILLDYEEHFLTGLSEGKTEEAIAEELGTPEDVAKEYGVVRRRPPVGNMIFGVIGIILFDLFIAIYVLITLFSIWLSLWAVVLGMLIGSVGLIAFSAFAVLIQPIPWYVMLFTGISLLGLSVLSGIGMFYVSKWFFKAVQWFVNLHVKIFTNR